MQPLEQADQQQHEDRLSAQGNPPGNGRQPAVHHLVEQEFSVLNADLNDVSHAAGYFPDYHEQDEQRAAD
ncbi:MAG: hypothetical protein BWY09_02518 [Candidatus Hydrogenedentes bacterium ADurb.Bin179]|nr:MAG: hypothetical protein BWY09_02518 [Candidatus Hydrogenedentes bacterium ADurb.Bin179]